MSTRAPDGSSPPPPPPKIAVGWWVLLVLLLIWNIVALLPGAASEVDITYSEFIDQVVADNVAQVTIRGAEVTDVVEMGEYDTLIAGDTVFVIGNPGGFGWWVVSGGEFIGELGPNDKPDSFATTASAAAGDSGSPFFNAAGEVVGLLWGNPSEPPAALERTITDIIWDPTEFWDLRVHGSAGHPVDVAMATATRIIDSSGNVP